MEPIASFSGLASGIQWRDMIEQLVRLETSRRLGPVSQQLNLQEKRRTAWSDYGGLISKLRDASKSFSDGTAFNSLKATVGQSASGRALISATASESAAPATYKVEVLGLAQAEKVGSAAVTDPTAALNLSGTFVINNRQVTLTTSDSLNSLRDKINAVNSGTDRTGVTATILSTSANSHRLVLTADETGTRGIELVDSSNGVLKNAALGLLSSGTVQNASLVNSAQTETRRASSTSASLATALGVSPPPTVTTIRVDGRQITVDFANDTLLTLQNKIISAGGSAQVRQETVNGKTMHRLAVNGQVTADASATDPANSQRVVELLGFQKNRNASQLSTGLDSRFEIDNLQMTRRTNTVSDAIQGVTLDLLATDVGSRVIKVNGEYMKLIGDPKTLGAGTYAINASGGSVTRTVTTSGATLSGAVAPSNVKEGQYNVNVTQLATVAGTTGSGFDSKYDAASGNNLIHDWIEITGPQGRTVRVNLIDKDTTQMIVDRLNSSFTSNTVQMEAVNVNGQVRLQAKGDPGSASAFTVTSSSSSVFTNLGIADGTHRGTDIRGTINGEPATGVGRTLTADAGTSVAGLQVTYTGANTGAVGWVKVDDAVTAMNVTIDGEAVDFDTATSTIRGRAGTRFDGLVIEYTAAGSGKIGELVIEGDTAVDLKIERDRQNSEKQVKSFVDAYNAISSFVKKQNNADGPLDSNGSLRAMLNALRTEVMNTVSGLSADNPYNRVTTVGVEFTRDGTLSLDSADLTKALEANPTSVAELFKKFGEKLNTVADRMANEYTGTVKLQRESLDLSISTLKRRETNIQQQLDRYRDSLVRQFSTMEDLMAKFQSQGSWLSSQLSGLRQG